MRFVNSNSQIYYDNLHQGAPFRYCRPNHVYFYELRPIVISRYVLFIALLLICFHTLSLACFHTSV